MKITILSIAKPENDCYAKLCDHFAKMAARWAKIEGVALHHSRLRRAHNQDPKAAKALYAELFKPWMGRGKIIALDPGGQLVDTQTFASFLSNHAQLFFLIGGAYGHSEETLRQAHMCISLSPLTLGHKVAHLLLCEQIYRALTLLHGHPYHK